MYGRANDSICTFTHNIQHLILGSYTEQMSICIPTEEEVAKRLTNVKSHFPRRGLAMGRRVGMLGLRRSYFRHLYTSKSEGKRPQMGSSYGRWETVVEKERGRRWHKETRQEAFITERIINKRVVHP